MERGDIGYLSKTGPKKKKKKKKKTEMVIEMLLQLRTIS